MCGNTAEPLTNHRPVVEVRQMAARNDITGQKFGRLTVLYRSGTDRNGKATWICRCDCGGMSTTITSHLRNGNTRSCGCLQKEKAAISAKKVQPLAAKLAPGNKHGYVHGHTSLRLGPSPTYSSWQAMLGRCIYPKSAGFYRYGGRGITVCERWKTFENFLEDVGERPSVDYCIARNGDLGNYEPGNAWWKLKTENQQEMLSRRRVKALVRRWWITK